MKSEPQVARIIHLANGLKAYDFLQKKIRIGFDYDKPIVDVERIGFHEVYSQLVQLGLTSIGVEFYTAKEMATGKMPTEFVPFFGRKGFIAKRERDQWSSIEYASMKSKDFRLAEIAENINTYLSLLSRRLYYLSNAYRSMIWGRVENNTSDIVETSFSNLWKYDVDAAIHSFLTEACILRDVFAEGCWQLVLKKDDDSVSTMSSLLKKAKNSDDDFVEKFLIEGRSGGWVKNLSDIRNQIVHVAPVSSMHEFSFCEIREIGLSSGHKLIGMHYPFNNVDGTLRKRPKTKLDFSSDEEVKKVYDEYKDFSKESNDALYYCWRTLGNLVSFSQGLREYLNLSAEPPKIEPIKGTFKLKE